MTARARAKAQLRAFAFAFFGPLLRMRPSAWIVENILLPSSAQETDPGPVSFRERPYLKEPIDCVVEPGVRDVVWIGPTRAGKTFILRMVWAYVVAVLRLPSLWYDSTINKARSISKKELRTLVEANRVLRERKPANPDDYATTQMLFPGAHFEMFGANSDAQASGETAAVIFGNEVGKWRAATEKEASILDQVRHRTESFKDERRHYFSTTPRTDSDEEWLLFLSGDRRKWHVPCPHCGHLQPLEWERVKWAPEAKLEDGSYDLERVKDSVRYHCSDCEGPGWTQEQLWAAVRDEAAGAGWRPTVTPADPKVRSYQLNGLYGPLDVNRMDALAVRYHAARGSGYFLDRQDFWNSGMGLPWINEKADLKHEHLEALTLGYFRGECPEGVQLARIVVGADVQTWGLPWAAWGFDARGNAYLLDHGKCATFEDLEAVQDILRPLARSWVIIDINFEDRRAETLEAIYRRKDRGWLGAEGFEIARDLVEIKTANPFMGTKLEARRLEAPKLVISLFAFKVELERRLAGEVRSLFFYRLPSTARRGDADTRERSEVFAELLDERRVPRKKKLAGKPVDEFRPRTGNNHRYDCTVYALALDFYLRKRRQALADRKRPGDRPAVQVEH